MKTIPLYSLVIFPSLEQLELVKSYKQWLKSHIGWFGTANAAAHITVINFDDDFSFHLSIAQIRAFCKTVNQQKVRFNSWDSFGDRTFFIAPNQSSKYYLDQLILDLHHYLGFKINNAHAHLSIARGLDTTKMKATKELFQNTPIDFEFNCDAIYVRKFNTQTKQYSDVIEKISFGN